jgi:hypothetical protein
MINVNVVKARLKRSLARAQDISGWTCCTVAAFLENGLATFANVTNYESFSNFIDFLPSTVTLPSPF